MEFFQVIVIICSAMVTPQGVIIQPKTEASCSYVWDMQGTTYGGYGSLYKAYMRCYIRKEEMVKMIEDRLVISKDYTTITSKCPKVIIKKQKSEG